MFGQTPIIPRNGHALVVGIVARISGGQNQKELSLDDQSDHAKEVVAEMYQGPTEFICIATKGKGERLDRPELAEVEKLLRSRNLDVLICEDLGRLVRGAEACWLCGIAVDHGTRVLAPNDCVDTTEDSWEEDVLSACRDHVGHNAHTSKRLKHKLMNRFLKFGGAMAREIFGFIVPDDATTYDDWQKDLTLTPIIREAAKRLRATLNCSAVADWLNAEGVPVGPYCRNKRWNGSMVRRFFGNSVLKGMPGRGFKKTIKHHETGRRVSVPNPKGPNYREYPELAHLDADEFDELNAALSERNAPIKRKHVDGQDPLFGHPRKRTVFPGQHARCWYCGRQYIWGANGLTENLMCSGAREWRCWNSIGFAGALAGQKVIEAITSKLYQLNGFDAQFRDMVLNASKEASGGLSHRWTKLRRDEEQFNREKENLKLAIKTHGPRPILEEVMAELDARARQLVCERRRLEAIQGRPLNLPSSISQLRDALEKELGVASVKSPEFGDLLRLLVPEFQVYLVRLCDGGHVFPRAKVRLNLAGSFEDVGRVPGIQELLSAEITLDLFEPPQREQIRVMAVQLRSQGLILREIAQKLPGRPSQTAVGNSLALQTMMEALGLASPFVALMEPPNDYPKLRRYLNHRYQFKAIDSFKQLSI